MVSRKVVLSPCRSSTSTAAYSLNSRGQFSRSLVMSQTRSTGAAMRISLSVCPGMSGSSLRGCVDRIEELPRGFRHLGAFGDGSAIAVLQLAHDAEQPERVDAELVQGPV